ncbi:MAG: FAD-dependent thymidylate synthase [Candidatus Diapherotrites archaeon]
MFYSDDDKKILENFVTNLDKNIYIVHNLPPEVVSVLFAYVSRSPESFRTNLLKLVKEGNLDLHTGEKSKEVVLEKAIKKASDFQRKWVVGFGHFSIAEHAVVHIAIENISILATKILEDNRLASYTEKSTRYQKFDRNTYYKPKKIIESKYGKNYEETLNGLFDFYVESFPVVENYFKEKYPKKEEMSEQYYASYIKSKACDVLRYLLPTATLTNLGATFNARSLAHAIEKLLSHPLEEAQQIGQDIKAEATKIMPTLGGFAEKSTYIQETTRGLQELAKSEISMKSGKRSLKKHNENKVKLVNYTLDAEERLIAAIMYKFVDLPYQKVLEKVKKMDNKKKKIVFEEFFKRISNKDAPLRELEHSFYTFEITVDYGAYRDLQRHRMCTQTTQMLTTKHGFCIPEEMKNLGLEKEFVDHMKKANELYFSLVDEFPYEAQYCVPLAFRNRTIFTMNARELYHIIRLRSGKAGHKSYRKVAQQMYFELQKAQPLIAKYFAVDLS